MSTIFLKIQYASIARMPSCWKRALGWGPLFRPWVAEIVGTDPAYGLARQFLKSKVENGPELFDSRVYAVYLLRAGCLYEINAPLDWNHTDRYFCTVMGNGHIKRLNREEVKTWMQERGAQKLTSEKTC